MDRVNAAPRPLPSDGTSNGGLVTGKLLFNQNFPIIWGIIHKEDNANSSKFL